MVWELNILVFGFFWKGKRELVTRRVVAQASYFGAFLLFLYNSRFGVCWFTGSFALLLVRLLGRGFSNTTLVFASVPHRWMFYHALQYLTCVGCHLFTAISCWHGRLLMVVSQLSGLSWQLVCPQALLFTPYPIFALSLFIPSYCRRIFLILTVSLSLHVILDPFNGLLVGSVILVWHGQACN